MKKARHGSRAFFDAEKSGGANGPQIIFVADLFLVLLIIGIGLADLVQQQRDR